ncbi:hypothetical protein HMPREF1531_02398 [Propionibacterium sp. oral taxon 192 str. F0372]|uniref:LOG family protein n=1 Tax=Propionibacterium sp. oral taxon 192 TaxID=671222 RepID=UPI0003535E07|nr:LOG family protein [Propionibacterium sp. oral taxon 192]EPH00290.1 hypothetical protein HMPREF1531_02398 [Propionibacterium sp. oral taxon 192 str. F0372]
MNTSHMPTLEIESLEQWDIHVSGVGAITGWVVQSVDLTERSADLTRLDPHAAIFLGCRFADGVIEDLQERGALIFPTLPDLPFDPYRARLWSATGLYGELSTGAVYANTTDAQIYAWYTSRPKPTPLEDTLAMSLHDHAITDALLEYLADIAPGDTVGIMGGHALQRDSDGYLGAARLASRLSRAGCTILTGGGPGAMEAANLGAHLAGQPAVLRQAINHLMTFPDFIADPTMWVASALEVLASTHPTGRSVGIPTWFYGHEPTNVFASVIAKYFSNALREDILLAQCRGGIVYLPGAAGTVQEVFQAATANYYAADPSGVVPMVFVGVEYWTETLPVWPLISLLGRERTLGERIKLVGEVDEAADHLLELRTDRGIDVTRSS